MVFRDKMYQVPTLSEIYGWKKLLPFTKIDTCTIMPEAFINIFMLFFFIYKSCNLLNHAWDSHTIGQFFKNKSNNTAAFITTGPCRTNKCLTIYCTLNDDNINYTNFYLVGQWKCHVTSTTYIYIYIYIYICIYIYTYSISQKYWVHPSHFGNHFSMSSQGTIL